MSTFMKIGNTFMKLLLRSPLHGMMSKNTLLISFTGKKSGKTFTTPVNYSFAGEDIRIFSSKDRVWWRNLVGGAMVSVRIQGKNRAGTANVIQDENSVIEALTSYLNANPQIAKYFNVKIDPNGQLDKSDLVETAKQRVVVEVRFE